MVVVALGERRWGEYRVTWQLPRVPPHTLCVFAPVSPVLDVRPCLISPCVCAILCGAAQARAFRTNACMADVLRVAEDRLGIPPRKAKT